MGELLDGRITYREDENGCWICTSHAVKPNGMGAGKPGYYDMKIDGRTTKMHRHIFHVLNERINDDIIIRHTCDNPLCINPSHLISGTVADNVADRVARDRSAKGEQNGRAKLTEEQVRNIFLNRSDSPQHLANRYGVSKRAITLIWERKNWRSVTESLEAH